MTFGRPYRWHCEADRCLARGGREIAPEDHVQPDRCDKPWLCLTLPSQGHVHHAHRGCVAQLTLSLEDRRDYA